ncbi:MAG: PD-(D/E)XK nuclease family protein, partial [Bdellovibrionales bacterium]
LDEVILSTALSRFSGGVEAPSKLWIMAAQALGVDSEKMSTPDPTHLNHRQLQFQSEFVDYDLGKTPRPNISVKPEATRLSVSQIEGFLSCPFIFMARKLFRLAQLPEMELDVDHMTRGKVMHALFEKLTAEPFNSALPDEELRQIVSKCIEDEKINDDFTQQRVVTIYMRLAKRFLEFEKGWREQFPRTKTVGREARISAFWSLETGELVKEGGDFPFLGFVDRIDSDQEGHLLLIDYKSSSSQEKNYGSWLKYDQLQMAVYAYAVDSGLCEEVSGEVVGANYFVAKTFSRNKGFLVKSKAESLAPRPGRGTAITEDEKFSLYSDVKAVVQNSATAIAKGELQVNPKELSQCLKCDWKQICRAPHLI